MSRLIVLASLALLPAAAVAQSPMSPPGEIGLSSEKLQSITAYLQREVDDGRVAGAVAAVSRHGRVAYLQAVGQSDLASDKPLQTDSLFRIASMTKAITSAAVMSLIEDGELSLDDPLPKYLPEFSTPRLLQDVDAATTVEDRSQVSVPTIHDLLTHRSGLTYGWFGPKNLDAIYEQHEIPNLFEPTSETMGDRVQRIAKVPLKFHPGTAWDYGVSTDVLGRVVEVVSGLTLDQFFRERFFRPLKMRDTYFYVPADKQSRVAGLFTTGEDKMLQPVGSEPVRSGFFRFSADYCILPGRFYSGGGGLVSTASDYMRFLHMLLRGGELDGVRVLKRETVAMMTQNQIGEMKIYLPGHGDGFGFGFGIVTDRGAGTDEMSAGSFSWGGIFNTYFWVDPQEELVGVLMTQLFPNDHLTIRDGFRKLVYEAIDESGFERLYRYQAGNEHANPSFNNRQLRVNGAEVSTHPRFASRNEPRSSGMARIKIEEDLRKIRRADLDLEIWGGHPGTENKRVTVNGRSTYLFPEVGSAKHNCTHQYPSFNLRPMDLVNGYNSLQFACDTGDTFWGHYIVDRATLRIGLPKDDKQLVEAGLGDFDARLRVIPLDGDGEGFALHLDVAESFRDHIANVKYEARYFGYDADGDGWRTDWQSNLVSSNQHRMIQNGDGWSTTFSTAMLPAQNRVAFCAIVELKDAANLRYRTPTSSSFSIEPRDNEKIHLFTSDDLPHPFWSRDNQAKECTIDIDVDPREITSAELNVVTWTGGAGEVSEYFTLNGKHFPVAEGNDHKTVYSRIAVDPKLLRRGKNKIVLRSDTKHHGIEVMLPGPALMIRHRSQAVAKAGDQKSLKTAEQLLIDDIELHSLNCYRIKTPAATYYLDKVGAGLASMIDRDGKDWLSFRPERGSGAAGEYRGFPNAVFKEAGSYFHARNSGTDPCVTKVIERAHDRIVISAEADNGLWAGRYTFTPTACTFTMTNKPDGHNYWVLYEGTPGGQYDDSDWWMTAADKKKRPMAEKHDADLTETAGTEWIAFGDENSERMLVLSHAEGDSHPDHFYQMDKQMTVFGFGRSGMQKHLNTVPQSFTIGFVESTQHSAVGPFVEKNSGTISAATAAADSVKTANLVSFALTQKGDAAAGAKLFTDQRTKCSVCHRIDKKGGQVGPDLTSVGNKYDRPHLIDALLYPSRQIGYGYETTTVLTSDGKATSGVARESDNTHITLLDSNNKRIRIAKADIEETKVSKTSIMPAGLQKSLSRQEFVDLVTYLETLGRGSGKPGSGVSGPLKLADGFQLTTIATGLSGAVAMEVAPDGRIFICEQGGTLRIIKDGTEIAASASDDRSVGISGLLPQPFVTIPVEMNWERGLIGVTVSPKFPTDPYVYVVYVTDKPHTHHRISRFRADGDVAVPGSEEILFRGDDQSKFGGKVPAGHQGGGIHFGSDGKLYVGLGEQTAGEPSQRMDAFQGKILRLNPDGSIPNDNPFINKTRGRYQAIWAKGCRNPFTFAFSESGQMLINDVGGKFEEVNRGIAGANYGWPDIDHGPTDQEGITGPIHIYPQSSINGGDFCSSSSNWPEQYRSKYFFADFVRGWVKYINPQSPEKSHEFLAGVRRPVDIRFGVDGSLYVLLRNAWVVDKNFQGGTGALLKVSRK